MEIIVIAAGLFVVIVIGYIFITGCAGFIGIPLGIIIVRKLGQQRAAMEAVELEKLSDGEQTRWQAWSQQLEAGRPLSDAQMATVMRWRRGAGK